MSWVFYSLMAAMLWAVVNVTDRYTMTKLVDNPLIPIAALSIINLLTAAVFYGIRGLTHFSSSDLVTAFFAAVFYVLTMFFYYLALKYEEVSKVIPVYYLSPVFILFIAYFLLNENLAIYQYIGVFFLVSGAIIVTLKSPLKFGLSRGVIYIILAAFCYAFNQILTKWLLKKNEFWSVFAYIRIGIFLFLLPVFFLKFIQIRETLKKTSFPAYGIITLNQLLNVTGVLSITSAMNSGYVSLVNAIASVQPLFVFILTLLLGFFFPAVLKETINLSVLLKKLIAILFIITGVLILS